ncbi:MAG: PH domain-containing protein [Lapillicoccus sp.]
MATATGLQRYLLDGERVVVAMHQHWAKVSGPIALAVVGLVVALFVDARTPAAIGAVSTGVWWAWFVLLAWALWRVFEWRHDWFVATDKRLLLTYGVISQRVAMMPLSKVTDMSYERSAAGRVLGYGQFILESAGQDQALRDVKWIPQPDHTYRAICAEIFGVEDHDRVLDRGSDDDLVVHDSRWEVASPDGTAGPAEQARPAPYAGQSAVEEYGSSSRAIPLQHNISEPESLYLSEDLRRRRQIGDTGPIPLYRPDDGD